MHDENPFDYRDQSGWSAGSKEEQDLHQVHEESENKPTPGTISGPASSLTEPGSHYDE